ncbi:MAG: hypothetical protein KF884_05795 [Fimbriimonadaceae bacterium]|nr:hypothetical protein [Fimbriimonadaceae bacterium]QYK59598.1 MAG: hypothetical protein KF884_05795 [Fimbriimonadaceae bacterium]
MNYEWQEILIASVTLVTSTFAMLRLSLVQQRALIDRFVTVLESALERQARTLDGLGEVISDLRDGVRENTHHLRELSDWLHLGSPLGGER